MVLVELDCDGIAFQDLPKSSPTRRVERLNKVDKCSVQSSALITALLLDLSQDEDNVSSSAFCSKGTMALSEVVFSYDKKKSV